MYLIYLVCCMCNIGTTIYYPPHSRFTCAKARSSAMHLNSIVIWAISISLALANPASRRFEWDGFANGGLQQQIPLTKKCGPVTVTQTIRSTVYEYSIATIVTKTRVQAKQTPPNERTAIHTKLPPSSHWGQLEGKCDQTACRDCRSFHKCRGNDTTW